jgi:PBP1b-binding outer membrane lipoprotein LpoB
MKLLSILLLAITAFVFAGCDSGSTPPAKSAPATNAAPAAPAAPAK